MRKFLISFCLLITVAGYGQNKLKFRSQNYIGILEGEAHSAFHLQTINGFGFNKWFGGIGTGLDYYFLRSIPVFLSVSHDFSLKPRTFFISADAGYSFTWESVDRNRWNDFISQKYVPAPYWSGGLGYRVGMKNGDGILLNVGYSFKHIKEKREQRIQCINPPCDTFNERYDYRLKRLSLKVGWLF